jgi:GDP/UDP-N,N'-diacetylbacillosamine 2-epimerase (hydrolysing)
MSRRKRKRIAILTGIRSEYHILEAVMKAIEEHPRLDLKVIVTGTHLSPRFGSSWKEVAAKFPLAAKIPSLSSRDSLSARLQGLSRQIAGLTKCLEKLDPDITCVLGDREESICAATVCAYLHRACAHISGGDRGFGTVDDSVRHAVSKLAHLHFPTTRDNRRRLLSLGEEAWRVKAVGASGLDRLRRCPKLSRRAFLKAAGLPLQGDFVIILQHPVSFEKNKATAQMKLTLETLRRSGLSALVVYPNSDPGSHDMIAVIESYRTLKHWKIHKNLDDLLWCNALRHARALVGNSSAGLLEAPFMACPAINIGLRQSQRQARKNLLRVPHESKAILKALEKAAKPAFRNNLKQREERLYYGDGRSGERIAKILAKTPVDARLLNKKITY